MHSLLQPIHLFFMLLIVLILFGPGKLPELGKGLGRGISGFRGHLGRHRGLLFMAKGVDPAIGRDVGDMLPEEDANGTSIWVLGLRAILVGNCFYFSFSSILPAAARFGRGSSAGLPALVDLWFCFIVFGLLNLWEQARKGRRPKK